MSKTTSTTTTDLAIIPNPARAVRVYDWDDRGGIDPLQRYFVGESWVVERGRQDRDLSVFTDGIQYWDRTVKRVIAIGEGDAEAIAELTATHARELAAALIAAGDEIEAAKRDRQLDKPVNPLSVAGAFFAMFVIGSWLSWRAARADRRAARIARHPAGKKRFH